MMQAMEKAEVLIEALPYIQKFSDAIVVIKFGGSAMEDPGRPCATSSCWTPSA